MYAHNTKPEVDIMRNGNKSRQLLSLARIFVLALCFTLVFAAALIVSDDVIADNNSNNIANAGYVVNTGGCVPYDLGINASSFVPSATANGWVFERSLTDISLSADNATGSVSLYKPQDTDVNVTVSPSNNKYIVKAHDKATLFMSIRSRAIFDVGEFVRNIAQSELYTVKVTIGAQVNYNAGGSDRQSGSLAIAKLATASTDEPRDPYSETVTLTKEKRYVAFETYITQKAAGLGTAIEQEIVFNSIKIEILNTFKEGVNDGGAPIVTDSLTGIAGLENEFEMGIKGNNAEPKIYNTLPENQGKFPLYYDSIMNRLKTDSIVNGSGTLASYTNKALGTVPGQTAQYYKYVQTEYVDTFNSTEHTFEELFAMAMGDPQNFDTSLLSQFGVGDKEISIADSTVKFVEPSYAHFLKSTGIKTVKVGNTVFDITNSNHTNPNKATPVYVTEKTDAGDVPVLVGYATVNKLNRSRVAVCIYFVTNCKVQTTVADFNNEPINTYVTVSGIDTTAPDATTSTGIDLSSDNFMNTSATALPWLRQDNLDASGNFELLEEKGAGYSPYIWFYTVNRADSLAALNAIGITEFADYKAVKNAGIQPIAVENLNGFYYDFKTGRAKDASGKISQASVIHKDGGYEQNVETGHGYYRFTFYTFDLAGNKGEVKTYYVKVDYDKPTYTLDFSYDKNGTQTSITAAENGKKWATGDVTLKFTLTGGGFSGFTFKFNDTQDAAHALVFNGVGEFDGASYVATMLKYMTETTSQSVVDNQVTLTIDGVSVTVKLSVADGKPVITLSVPAPAKDSTKKYFDWLATFTAYEGKFDNIADIDFSAISYEGGAWSNGVNVLIDNQAPDMPTFTDDENGLIKELANGYEIPAQREWYTAYKLTANLGFSDAVLQTDYVGGITIHYGLSVVKNQAELQKLASYNIATAEKTKANFDIWFNRYRAIKGAELNDGGITEIEADFLATFNAGMRVIHIWAEDQAGNVSAVNTYYIFADATNYNVSAAVKNNKLFEKDFANVKITNDEGVAISSVKRGQVVNFNFEFKDNSYVPFAFTQNGTKLLENYTPSAIWTNNGKNAGYINAQNATAVAFTFDDIDNLGTLTQNNKFELAARKVVSYTQPNPSVGYTAKAADVISTIYPDYEQAKSAYEFTFVDDAGSTIATPTKVGEYKVRIYIPKANESFVMNDFAMDEDGNQIFTAKEFSITKGKITITITPSTSEFGLPKADVLGKLKYTIEGIDQSLMAGEGISVKLTLATEIASGATYPVGAHTITTTADSTLNANNYDVTVVSAIHNITKRNIVIDAWSARKEFADADPDFKFGVGLAQFAGLYKSADEIVADAFKGYRKDDKTVESGYAIYFANGRINREEGEGVGNHAFLSDSKLFDVDSNFSVSVQTTKYQFEITKRTVTLDVSGQSSVFKFGTTIDGALLAQIAPTYKLGAEDMVVASDVAALFANGATLKLDSTATTVSDSNYSLVQKHTIVLGGTLTDGNVEIALGTDAEYVVYVTAQGTVVIKAKDDAKFEFVYGTINKQLSQIVFDMAKFDVASDGATIPEYTTVTWTASVDTRSNWLDAGRYVVTVSGAKLVNNGVEVADTKVFVEPFAITVTPAKVVLKATASSMSKVYGDPESVYGIDFAIASINGADLAVGGTYADQAYADIKKSIKGEYVRAIFDKNNAFVTFANKYDDATDSTGAIFATDGNYYGVAVATAFHSNNANFTVEANDDSTLKLAIAQKTIDLETQYFVGVGKVFNGNTDVDFGDKLMYDLSLSSVIAGDESSVIAGDDVRLDAVAAYDTAAVGDRKILFSALALKGGKAHNYTLGKIVNNGYGTLLNDTDSPEMVIDENTSVQISYEDNRKGLSAYVQIKISAGKIELSKNNVIVSKQYDNNNKITKNNVSFANVDGTKPLLGANMTLLSDSTFSGTKVSDRYIVSISLFFTFDNLNDEYLDIPESKDSDITIIKGAVYGDKTGVRIEIKNLPAEITKRVLNGASFDSVAAVDRDYNATDIVDMTYALNAGALADGDSLQTLGLKLKGKTDGKDAGLHSVTIDSGDTVDANYQVDVASLNATHLGIKAQIAKARLVPNVTFEGKTYDATSVVTVNGKDGTFTTVQYADNLKDVLGKFSYDTSKVAFELSLNGKADSNVQANGRHNVLVSGLNVTFNGTKSEKDEILKNFVLDGARYSDTDKKYSAIATLAFDEVDDFELLDVVAMSKKQINLILNDFVVKDKIYDGTTNANVTIDITDDRMVEEHKALLEIVATGAFAKKQKGINVQITGLVATLGVKGGLDEANLALALAALNNYELVQYKGTVTGNIVARPLLINADLGTRDYNGDETIVNNNITYTFTNMIESDVKGYSVQTLNNAYFDDKNVAVKLDAEGNPVLTDGNFNVIAKGGVAYGLNAHSKDNSNNYTLVYNSSDEIAGKSAKAFVLFGDTIVYEKPADLTQVKEFWYELETSQKYVKASNTAQYEAAKAATAIVGFYKVNGEDAYLVLGDYSGDCSMLEDPTNYFRATGKITQRTASIRASGVEMIPGSKAFEKVYDGTDVFFGKNNVDFKFAQNAVNNVIGSDNVTIKSVSAKFDTANTTAKYVVFTASGIDGKDAYNYTIAGQGTSVEVKLAGKIAQRAINAHLQDEDKVEYGIGTGDFAQGRIEYSLVGNDGNEYPLTNKFASDGAFYMNFKQYLLAVGFIDDAEADITTNAYANLLVTYTYNLNGDKFEKAAEGATGEYIRLGNNGANVDDAISKLPIPRVTFASTTPNAGDKATSYVLNGGNARNYSFVPVYTNKDNVPETNGTSSAFAVVKKDLFVTTDLGVYNAIYGSYMNDENILTLKVGLRYLDRFGKDGIVGGVAVNRLFANGATSYFPSVKLGVFNKTSGTITEADISAKISSDLKADECYVLYVVSTYDYNTLDTGIKNYNVILAGKDSVANAGGTVVFDVAGAEVKFGIADFKLDLPKLTGVKVGSETENEFKYTYAIDKDGNAVNRLRDAVQGEFDTDEVIFVDDNGNELKPELVGTYSGTIRIKRYINANGDYVAFKDKDANGYFIEWNSGAVKKSVIIEQADVGIKAQRYSEYYNGKAHVYETSGGTNRVSYNPIGVNGSLYSLVLGNDYVLSFEVLNKDGKYEAIDAKDVVNAGKYRVSVSLTDSFLNSEVGKNYKQSTAKADLQVLRAIVNVSLDATGYNQSDELVDGSQVKKFTGEYVANKKYTIGYTVAMGKESNDPSIAITKEQTKLIGLDNIASAGRFPFAVVLNDANLNENNYVFLSSTGVVELTTKNLAATDGSSVSIGGKKGVVANRLEVKDLKQNHSQASDMTYLEAVEQYVEVMRKNANVKDARVAALLKVNLYLDDQLVFLPGEPTTVTVTLSDAVKSMKGIAVYRVTAKGGLEKLTDYTVEGGKMTYTTDYVDGIVFVDLNAQGLETWKVAVICVSIALLVIIVVATTVTIVMKKSKLKKLA